MRQAVRPSLTIFIVVALAALMGCAAAGESAEMCPNGSDEFAEYHLYFGRSGSTGAEAVSEEAWAGFLADTVTPRFPDGLTVMDGAGQWQNSSGEIMREGTKVLFILAEPGDDSMRLTGEVISEYKSRFGQESVLLVAGTACASF